MQNMGDCIMRAHVITDGKVSNTIEVESLDFMPGLIEATEGRIGWLWGGAVLTAPLLLPPTREELKAARTAAVEAITVTTAAGNTFDGDETSQTRMARAIIALQATNTPSVNWVLANNTAIQATAAELVEALALSGAAQAAVWVI